MVEDRITDPRRIAQLLASELTGLATGPLAAVEVVDADRSAAPAPEGTDAYRIAYRGRPVGRVRLFPDAAVVELDGVSLRNSDLALPVERDRDTTRLRVESGAAVKRAVDAIRATL
jgi:hypothetical protein